MLATLPELILGAGSLVLLMVGAWAGDRHTRLISWLAVALIAAAGISLLLPSSHVGAAFGGLYMADSYAAFAKALIYIAGAIAIVIAPDHFSRESIRAFDLRAEYPVLILLSLVGMGMMVSAIDLLTLYVGLELQNLASYVLAAFHRRDSRSSEAGLKYFVLGALASGILLYGISLLYGFTGTTSFSGIADAIAARGLGIGELFGLVFVLAGLAFKIAAVPFHMWTPDVYEGSPTPITTFFASAPKVAAMALLVRVAIGALGPAEDAWRQVVIFSAIASILLSAAAAIGQTSIKRLMAYSSINNMGFALIGLAAGGIAGVASVLFYMAVYIAMTIGAFLCILQMRDREGRYVETISSLSGLSHTRPGLAAAFAMFMFSLAGIPPLFGFWPKFVVFAAAVKAGLVPLAVIGIVGSVVTAFYYLKIVKTIYFDEPASSFAPSESRFESGLIALAAAFISPLGYFAIPSLSAATLVAARALF
jgi:NADH-quinone oxidoreductase subunit N